MVTCPNCGSKLIKKDSRRGPFLSCSNFPKCRFSMDYKPENINIDWHKIDKCPNCGGELVKRKGKFGEFLSCSNFPKCRFSMDYKPQNDVKIFDGESKCPRCGSKLVKKNGRKGPFMSCADFPKCRYSRDLTEEERNNNRKNHAWNSEQFSFQDEKYKSKVKLAKDFVLSNLNMDTRMLLEIKSWDEDIGLCMDILDDAVTIEDKKYIESVLGYARHRRDKRTSLEYACDLIVGWLIEDCTVEILNKLGYNTSLNSADKHRKILLKPTADSDLKVYIDGKEVLIEQVNDFTGYWKKTLHVPLRDNKYNNLKDENSLLFGIDYVNELFFILNVPETEANYIPYHKPFSKPAYAILITDDDFYNLDKLEFVLSKILSEY
ncbi:MAG: topoisomerase DNA-binding C4 zinc finger domain-containing protein [Methanobrevibacter sp.]|nr:topoisomerase DNA-binding C4 zinc finger domain-containing protein [Methanobrevibacter sp.]